MLKTGAGKLSPLMAGIPEIDENVLKAAALLINGETYLASERDNVLKCCSPCFRNLEVEYKHVQCMILHQGAKV